MPLVTERLNLNSLGHLPVLQDSGSSLQGLCGSVLGSGQSQLTQVVGDSLQASALTGETVHYRHAKELSEVN